MSLSVKYIEKVYAETGAVQNYCTIQLHCNISISECGHHLHVLCFLKVCQITIYKSYAHVPFTLSY